MGQGGMGVGTVEAEDVGAVGDDGLGIARDRLAARDNVAFQRVVHRGGKQKQTIEARKPGRLTTS